MRFQGWERGLVSEPATERLHVRAVEAPTTETAGPASRGTASRLYKKIGLGLVLTDALCITIALVVSYLLRFGLPPPLPIDWLVSALVSPFVWVAVFHAFRLHAPQHLSNWEEFSRTISASSLGVVLLVLASYWSKSSFSRAWVGLTWLFVVLLELTVRRFWRWRAAKLRNAGQLSYRTLIVGSDLEATRLGAELARTGSGYSPVGFVSVESRPPPPSISSQDDLDELRATILDSGADCLFVASTTLQPYQMRLIAQAARQTESELRVAANVPEMLAQRLTVQPVGNMMALALRPVRLSGMQATVKRAFDLVLAVPGLIVALPIIGAISLAIRLESSGSPFFRQERVTKGGRVFRMVKFRTMFQAAADAAPDELPDLSQPFFKLEQDPRLTRVGRFLRRFSLDELPQLWNVIRGDMSLVGPRPLPTDQVRANQELLSPRLEVHAGMTGWWQTHGRSDLDPVDALRMDIFYIENWSLGLDLYILLKTLGAVVTGRGAY